MTGRRGRWKTAIAVCALMFGLNACSSYIKSVGKTDIDTVVDAYIVALKQHIADLTIMLYRHNPDAIKSVKGMSVELRITQILEHPLDVSYTELRNKQHVNAINLALSPNFRGDRVFALMVGISGMLRLSYNEIDESFIFDRLDPQNLYTSARNLEIVASLLRQPPKGVKIRLKGGKFKSDDEVRLAPVDIINRMIALQDTMAKLVESSSNRVIKQLMQNMILLPVGI